MCGVTNTLYIRLDDLTPEEREQLIAEIDDFALELKREGKRKRVSAAAAALILIQRGLEARDNSHPKAMTEPPGQKQAVKARRK